MARSKNFRASTEDVVTGNVSFAKLAAGFALVEANPSVDARRKK
jgi:hypothetical protein